MAAPIRINEKILVPLTAIQATAVRASGPGGQNVNKVSSKVELRVDLSLVEGLEEAALARLLVQAKNRLDGDGHLLVTSQKTRDRERNQADAEDKVRALVLASLEVPKPRKATRPSAGAKRARLRDKRHTAARKQQRASAPRDD